MKKIILLCLLVLTSITLKAQTVNDVPLKDIDVDYVLIVGTAKLFSTKVLVEIDFGQKTTFFSNKETIIKDEQGKALEFNSMIDALNFMSKNGFEFVNSYVVTVNSQSVYSYLLKNKKNKAKE